MIQTKEQRREIIINKLIAFQVYKKDDHILHELSLIELERAYNKFLHQQHPHDGFGSLKIRWRKK